MAVAFPDGWRVEVMRGHEEELLRVDYVWAGETCSFGLAVGAATAGEAAEQSLEAWALNGDIEIQGRAEVPAPVGTIVRLDARWIDGGGWSDYYFPAGDSVAWMECFAMDPPGDRWLHIAETLEAASDAAIVSEAFDGRVESPHFGFAMTLPSEWVAAGSGPRGGPPHDDGAYISVLYAFRGADSCRLLDLWRDADGEGWTTVEDMQQPTAIGHFGPDAETTYLELPAGRSARLDWSRPDGVSGTAYAFTDGSAWWRLDCASTEPPDDGWLSVAESFEFLSEG
jgi:hypothetical protein